MNKIVCISPASFFIGVTDLYLTNDGETFSDKPVQFEYSDVVPTLAAVVADNIHAAGYCAIRSPLQGGTAVTIRGDNFMASEASNLLQIRCAGR